MRLQPQVPDFYYEKASTVALGKTGYGTLLSISPDGDVSWSRQATVTLRCEMYFGNMPFDTQSCTYTLGMYSQTGSEVSLSWRPNMDGLDNWKAVSTSVWDVTGQTQENSVQVYGGLPYTYAIAQLTLKRQAQGYVISYLYQSIFFVAMSYGGFWINPAATPGRVALAVIMVLVVSNLGSAAKRDLPPFAYKTWLTDFMFISMIFNLIAFFEMVAGARHGAASRAGRVRHVVSMQVEGVVCDVW